MRRKPRTFGPFSWYRGCWSVHLGVGRVGLDWHVAQPWRRVSVYWCWRWGSFGFRTLWSLETP